MGAKILPRGGLRDPRLTITRFVATGYVMRLEAVILPDLGADPETPIVVSHWYVGRGGRVWEGERLVEISAGPLTFDVSAPATGRLVEIRGREDDPVKPGEILGYVAPTEEGGGGGDPDRDGGVGGRGDVTR